MVSPSEYASGALFSIASMPTASETLGWSS